MVAWSLARWFATLLFLSVSTVGYSQTENWQSYEYSNFVGGLNDSADPTVLKPNEASDLQNVVFTTSGAIRKRDFFAPITVSDEATCGGSAATGLAFYKQADGDRFLVAVCANDTIQKMDYASGTSGPDGVWDNITGALVFDTSANTLADFAVAQDQIVIEDGLNTTAPYTWTGTGNAAALGGSPPNSTMVEFHKRHLWVAGNNTNTSRVTFSNLDDITTWTSTDFILVETDDGQPITGLKSGLDCLYVFKSHSIWRICGTNRDDFRLEQMVRGVGASNNQAITVINNQFVFQTFRGDIAVYDGGIRTEIISGAIEGTLSGLEFDRTRLASAVAFDDGTGDEDFYLSVTTSGQTQNNRLLVFDTLHKAWTKFTGIHANALAVFETGSVQQRLLFSDYQGVVNEYPTTHANANMDNPAYYRSGISHFGVPQQKTFHLAQVLVRQEANGHELSFQPRIDFASSASATDIELAGSGAAYDSAIYDTSTYADLTTTLDDIEIANTGNYFQWYVENLNDQEPFLLRNVRIWFEPTGRVSND